MKKLLRDNWPFAFLLAAIVAIFSTTWGKFVVLPSPDSGPGPFVNLQFKLNEILSGCSAIDFHDILELIVPPYTFCDMTYPIDTFMIAVGLAWFLRARGLARTPAAFGGAMFALMGYSLTLVSAGHRGFFFLTVHCMFLLAFLARGLAGGRLANFALAGVCAAWALRRQPDFTAIYFILVAIYGLCAIVHKAKSIEGKRPFFTRLGKGVAIAAVSFGVAVFPTFRGSLVHTLHERQGTITQTSETMASAGEAKPDSDGGKSAESEPDGKWIFTTNWSLPPDEVLEFVAPSVMGRQTPDQALPYWGRLGRTWKWEETKQGFFNYRQHLVYIGAIPLMLALLALVTKKSLSGDLRFEARFWLAVWVVGLLLAFGRHTPFYRLFYALPYVSLMRAPVKFVRLVELATAILGAIGVQAFLAASTPTRAFRRVGAVAGALAVCFAAFAVAVAASPSVFLSPLKEIGADARLISAMSGNAVNALLHAVVGFALVAAALWWRGRAGAGWRATCALAILAAAVAIDTSIAYRPFAAANDIEFRYTSRNPVTQIALATPVEQGRPAVWSAVQNRFLDYALKQNLACHSVDDAPHDYADQGQFFSLGGNDAALRAMELSGCQYVVLPAPQARALPKGRMEPVCGLSPRNPPALFEKTMVPGKDDYLLARVVNPLPDAQFFTRWAPATEGSLMRDVALKMRGDWSQWTLPVVGATDESAADAVMPPRGSQKIGSVLGRDKARRTVVEVDAPRDGYLLLRWGYYERNHAWLDGNEVPQLLAGYHHTAVFVPAGRHEVSFANIGHSYAWTPVMFAVFLAFGVGIVFESIKG